MDDIPVYALGLGSNQRHQIYGRPRHILSFAIAHIDALPDCRVVTESRLMTSRPIGPSQRDYSNAAILVASRLPPPKFFAHMQAIETAFGRNRLGSRWRSRTLDIDILLWSGGFYLDAALCIPHADLVRRDFVLRPLRQIAGDARILIANSTVRHAFAKLHKMTPAKSL